MSSTEPAVVGAETSVDAIVVALDGPSGTGKSTVARALAQRLELRYIDTGAMYRAATIAVLDPAQTHARAGFTGSPESMAQVIENALIEVSTDPLDQRTWLNGIDVSLRIRSAEVTDAVSAVAADPLVRAHLVAQQRTLIGAGGFVVEGRDIASVVWPSADLKIYLTASEEVRAARRAQELAVSDTAAVRESLQRRDGFDRSRAASPLRRTAESIEVDTSELSIDAVVDLLVDLVLRRQVPVTTAALQ